MSDKNNDWFDNDAFKPFDEQFASDSNDSVTSNKPHKSKHTDGLNNHSNIYDGNLASIDNVTSKVDNVTSKVDDVADTIDPNGKQSFLSKLTHGTIDTTEKAGKGFISGIKNYLNPGRALTKVKSLGSKCVDGMSKGLNIKKGVAKGIIGSMVASGFLGAYMVGVNVTETI